MSTEAQIAAAKGIEPCPMCGSDQVRWRKRRPTDFVLTWLRWWVEFFAGFLSAQSRATRRSQITRDNRYFDNYDEFTYGTGQMRMDVAGEIREANTGHKTPKRFWNCRACGQEGHVF